MRFPDDVEILKPGGTDFYGNPGSFEDPERVSVAGFEVKPGETLLLPPDAPIADGDRVRVRGGVYTAHVQEVRSPSKTVLWTVTLKEVEAHGRTADPA